LEVCKDAVTAACQARLPIQIQSTSEVVTEVLAQVLRNAALEETAIEATVGDIPAVDFHPEVDQTVAEWTAVGAELAGAASVPGNPSTVEVENSEQSVFRPLWVKEH
jgi:hypothetical protein